MATKGTKEVKASDQKQYVPIHVHTNQNVNGLASAEGLLTAKKMYLERSDGILLAVNAVPERVCRSD